MRASTIGAGTTPDTGTTTEIGTAKDAAPGGTTKLTKSTKRFCMAGGLRGESRVRGVLRGLSVLCGSVLCVSLAGAADALPAGTQEPSALQRSLEIRQAQTPNDGEVHVLPVQGNVYMLVGAGGNIAVQIGEEGVLVVDTGTAQMSEKVLAAIKKLSAKPIRYIVNTHFHPDHTGGNVTIGKAGSTTRGGSTEIVAHENVLNRMSAPAGKQAPTPTDAWPTDTFFPEEKDFFFNDEAVMLYHDQAAHTDGDSIVFFRRSDVLAAGDIFITTGYPFIDAQNGGTIYGVINGLNRLLDIAVPKHEQEGGTYVIPGHGHLSDESEVLEYRDMLVIIKERVEDMVKRGMTLDQVKASKPTLDYDLHYGADTGSWTTAMFIEAVYTDVSRTQNQKPAAAPKTAAPAPAPKGRK
jgi:cyclase